MEVTRLRAASVRPMTGESRTAEWRIHFEFMWVREKVFKCSLKRIEHQLREM
jgi:hypothetical protein